MDAVQEFTSSVGFIVFFLVGTLIFHMLFGEQVTFVYLLLVLASMIYANVDKFENLVERWSSL